MNTKYYECLGTDPSLTQVSPGWQQYGPSHSMAPHIPLLTISQSHKGVWIFTLTIRMRMGFRMYR
jgi:hypothetical protein